MELGKPDAGKPPVRFDEGREPGGHWVQILSFRLRFNRQHFAKELGEIKEPVSDDT